MSEQASYAGSPRYNWWTPGRVETLKKLWADGKSCSVICAEMGATSRSAIIGKVHRLGLTRLCGTVKIKKVYRERRQRPSLRVIHDVRLKRDWQPPAAPVLAPAPIAAPVSKRLTLHELNERMCKWPSEGPPYTFCGADREDDRPYCAFHENLAHTKGTQKDIDRIANRILGGKLHMGKAWVAS